MKEKISVLGGLIALVLSTAFIYSKGEDAFTTILFVLCFGFIPAMIGYSLVRSLFK